MKIGLPFLNRENKVYPEQFKSQALTILCLSIGYNQVMPLMSFSTAVFDRTTMIAY
jgi:hypothetical protein